MFEYDPDVVPAGTTVFSRAPDKARRAALGFASDLQLPFDPQPERHTPALAGTLYFPRARLLVAGTSLPFPLLLNDCLDLVEITNCDIVVLRLDAGIQSFDVYASDHQSGIRRAFSGYQFLASEGQGGLMVPPGFSQAAWHICPDGLRPVPVSRQAIELALASDRFAA